MALALAVYCAPVGIAGTIVAINVKTQTSAPLATGFSGFNMPQLRNGVEYHDPKFVYAVGPLKPGWLRFPGGTASMAYDWNPADSSGGHIDIGWMNSLITGNPASVSGQPANILMASQQLTQAKGGVYLSEFATFVNAVGSQAIICFNGFTDTNPGSASLMAQAAQGAELPVAEWELANEPYVYPIIFPSAASYANAMNPYFTGITSATPGATIALFMAGTYPGNGVNYSSWDSGMSAYTPVYWNAVSTHAYPIPRIQSISTTAQTLNGILAHATADYINSYLNPLVGSNTPIYITELNCCAPDSDKFLTFLYNGIFLAEYIARMSSVPNVKGVGVNSLYTDNYDYHGIIQSVNDYESYLLNQVAANPNFSTDTATDPNTQFQFYMSAPGLALEVANQAINSSNRIWPTTVTGGPLVAIQGFDGKAIPAVYAQAYRGTDGSHYVLITNKSSSVCSTTIQLNGVHVSATMSITTVSNTSAYASNTATAQNNVLIQTATSNNPIALGPYSVTVVKW
ncbi:MAG TPA: hypothetical protein VKR61_10885 [Bryobacteraceae bacterium]|nr:hypothetical protein [Bryobacteraceae bacterium]